MTNSDIALQNSNGFLNLGAGITDPKTDVADLGSGGGIRLNLTPGFNVVLFQTPSHDG